MDCFLLLHRLVRFVLIISLCILPVVFWLNLNNNLYTVKSSMFKTIQLFDTIRNGNPCPLLSSKLVGWTNLSSEHTKSILNEDATVVEARLKESGVKAGGVYEPDDCQSRHKVAIVIPLRNRTEHLTIFVRYMHPFLQRQQLSYRIIVVEQSERSAFNRAMLMNIGFNEAQLLKENYQCFIFHDVDTLPEDDSNPYACPPVSIDYWNNYHPTPLSHFGGVTALSTHDFLKINGYANSFWGWGGEDDQLYQRVRSENLTVVRAFNGQSTPLAHYKTMSHNRGPPNPDRISILKEGSAKFKIDGLVDLRYKRLDFAMKSLFTHILVDIQPYNVTLNVTKQP